MNKKYLRHSKRNNIRTLQIMRDINTVSGKLVKELLDSLNRDGGE
jgi:translation initiation factor 2 beta subunit (eIF-2beta)/eIF-5